MNSLNNKISRRNLLRSGIAAGAGMALWTPGVFAEHLDPTPTLTEGPFYPYHHLPLNPDNDLIVVNNGINPSVGVITQLGGRLLDESGNPLKDAMVEIWQCDATAVYLAQGDDLRDKNFKGYGRFTTASDGNYRFRTIKPVPYPGRPAGHIHFKITQGNKHLLTTQLFIAGAPGNKNDGIYRDIGDALERELVSVDFKPVQESKIGEVSAVFDIVLGKTPADPDRDHAHAHS